MTDTAAIVPTSMGPAGTIVSMPDGRPRGAVVLLQGGGPPCRSGINGNWTRFARQLAQNGVAVLRFDFTREGESATVGRDLKRGIGWRRDCDLAVLHELAPWFRGQAGVEELMVAGSCHGGRVALDFAAEDEGVIATFMIVPYLWNVPPNLRMDKLASRRADLPRATEVFERGSSDMRDRDPLEEEGEITDDTPLGDNLVESCRKAVKRGPAWILVGEGDSQKPTEIKPRLGSDGDGLEVEVVPSTIIHPITHPEVQELVAGKLMDRVMGVLAAAPPLQPS